jgi:cytochrome c peroxidase
LPLDKEGWIFTEPNPYNPAGNLQASQARALPVNLNSTFFAGNRKFLTRKLWGAANEPPYFHHGQFTTLREAILAHAGEALASRQAFEALNKYEQGAVIEFLKTLRVQCLSR